jgi:hypothetical protein
MKNLEKLSRYLKKMFHSLAVSTAPYIILFWLLIEWPPVNNAIRNGLLIEPIQTPEGAINIATIQLSALTKVIGCCAQLLEALPYILGFFLLKKLFAAYEKKRIFTHENTQIYKRIGWLAFLNGIFFIPITQTLMVLTATLSNPPGHRCISLSFGTPNVESIFFGLLLVVISLVMQEAQALQEENQLTV